MALLNKEEITSVEAAVAEAETKTSGEIVPMLVGQSGHYAHSDFIWSLVGLGFAWLYMAIVPPAWGENWTALEMILDSIIGLSSGFALARIPFLKRLFVVKTRRSESVTLGAMAQFMNEGLVETRDRTGILIYISAFEHQAMILADKGINEKVEDNYWQEQVDHIVTGVKKKQLGKNLAESIAAIGDKLAEKFPPRKDDVDELSNQVRVDT